jgi:ADP-ribosylglycohydrolase
VWAFRNRDKDFRDAMLDIIFEGGDTDTNAAVAGGVLGAYKGYANLPIEYIEKMPHHDYLYDKSISFHNVCNISR